MTPEPRSDDRLGGESGPVSPTEPTDSVETASDAELERALSFLDDDRTPAGIEGSARRWGLAVGAAAALLGAALLRGPSGVPIAAAIGYGVYEIRRRFPCWLAALRRTRALGAAPGIVGRLVLRMRLEPSIERAVTFAAETGNGPLAESLADAAVRSRASPDSGLQSFTAEWSAWFPALERAGTRIRAAASAPRERRERGLDRALEAVTAGTTDRMAAFIGDVQAPVSGIYAFGVLLPLALIALLPAARATGLPLGAATMAVVYVVVLPSILLVASGWLLLRRPVAFPPPRIDASHPDVPSGYRRPLAAGVIAGIGGWVLGGAVVPWSAPIAAVGSGFGAGIGMFALPRRRVLRRVRSIEAALPDALSTIGGAVADGVAVERAVRRAGETMDGPAGAAFVAAGRRSRTLRVDVESALVGEEGPFADVPSPRVQGAVALLSIAAREGRPAGDVVIELADQLEELRTLERDATRQLRTVTRTLSNTATVFGPLVGGATVALAAGMDGGAIAGGGGLDPVVGTMLAGDPTAGAGGGASASAAAPAAAGSEAGTEAGGGPGVGPSSGPIVDPIPVPVLGRIVGTYVLLLSAILTALSTTIQRGLDPTLVAYRVGIAVPTATATYIVAFVGAGTLL
ncbi:type II secretion system F family protein [Halopenitus persicus]|uniref:Flp pilus assembly protein TadB n=1 Tax=Halopenitus persicus TaxID=1048396 RepID=A0A1H3G555_9EURY|nr:type II secretion system protein [Halopenitus persicus]SDX98463.1 Flp pilus assembly protein TadB [Halopenitus persicus]